ncbi:MAG: molybdopterin-dependent oxidoreductase [Gammaproteobacteria bacterium]|nr:molybdopterin-dependent oxidoreductase [Gammaproteobacteria bacterium]
MYSINPDRRRFLKISGAIAGSSLLIGFNWGCSTDNDLDQKQESFSPNAWLRISPDDLITVIVAESEMGQGPYTLMPMMVAEELEVRWDQIRVERASVDPVYGYQMTGGSGSIRKGWSTLRQAGAIAKEILLRAAALEMSVPYSECRAESGRVEHPGSGKSLSYGQLIKASADIAIPEKVFLKELKEFKIIGTPVHRKDVPGKIDGTAKFGIDTRLPGQLYATTVHCPVFDGHAIAFDSAEIRKNKNIIDVFKIKQGVAIVAKDTWSALSAAKKIKIDWSKEIDSKQSTESIIKKIRQADTLPAEKVIQKGDVDFSFKGAKLIYSRQYLQPFQAHMTMEPMNCTAWFKSEGALEIWVPTQSPSDAYEVAKGLTQSRVERGLRKIKNAIIDDYDDSISVNTTLLGGGFGRRLQQDYVSEAVQIAEHFEQPVQLVWSREEDVQHDYYHPLTVHEMKAVLDSNGIPIGWEHIIKGARVSSWGAEHSYEIENQRIKVFDTGEIIPKGPWRSVAPHYNVFSVEHFFDELAIKGNNDPVKLRLSLLSKSPRLRNVLELAADRVSWPGKSNGVFSYGSAVSSSFGSHVAQILKLEKISELQYRVNKVVCVIDCGVVINPDIVKQQMEGSIIFGLSAATKSKITLKKGRVEQSNFHDYPILRMDETPEIEVIIVQNEEEPGGIGEPGVPPVAPALANALMADTGQAIRELPIKIVGTI